MSVSFTIFNISHLLSRILDSGTSANPVPIAPERTPPSVDVVILPHWGQALLVSIEIQPSVQDTGRVRGLDQATADQSSVDKVLGRHDPGAAGGDGLCDLRLEGIDVQDGVLLLW